MLDEVTLEGWNHDALRNRLASIENDKMDLSHLRLAVELALDAEVSGMALQRKDSGTTLRLRFCNYAHGSSLIVPDDRRPPLRKEDFCTAEIEPCGLSQAPLEERLRGIDPQGQAFVETSLSQGERCRRSSHSLDLTSVEGMRAFKERGYGTRIAKKILLSSATVCVS